MNVLISKSFKAVRTGEYVTANEESGEFIINTEECEMANATIAEVLTANKIAFSKKANKGELLELLEDGVLKMKLPVQDQKPDSLKVQEIVAAAYEKSDEPDEDELLMEIVQSGVKFKHAGKLFKQALIDGGYLISAKDRTEECRTILVSAEFQPETWREVEDMILTLVDKVTATEYSQAYAQIRKYAKEFEIVLPKPEKKISAGGFKAKIYAFMIANPTSTKEQFFAWIVEDQDKEEKLAIKYWDTFELAQKITAAAISQSKA